MAKPESCIVFARTRRMAPSDHPQETLLGNLPLELLQHIAVLASTPRNNCLTENSKCCWTISALKAVNRRFRKACKTILGITVDDRYEYGLQDGVHSLFSGQDAAASIEHLVMQVSSSVDSKGLTVSLRETLEEAKLSLRRLFLGFTFQDGLKSKGQWVHLISLLGGCPMLEELHIRSNERFYLGVQPLEFGNLRVLSLCGDTLEGRVGFLSKLSRLEELKLKNFHFQGLKIHNNSLHKLSLENVFQDDVDIWADNLEVLVLMYCRLRVKVAQGGLNLKHVILNNSNTGIHIVSPVRALERLDVYDGTLVMLEKALRVFQHIERLTLGKILNQNNIQIRFCNLRNIITKVTLVYVTENDWPEILDNNVRKLANKSQQEVW